MATSHLPADYQAQIKASVDKAPPLSPQKRAALRTLLHPERHDQEQRKAA
ncbi:hypothetical protein ACFWC6_32160 [Micromonospora chalcea]